MNDYHLCPKCGTSSNYPYGSYSVLNFDPEGAEVFESIHHSLIINKRIYEKIKSQKWKKIYISKLKVIEKVPDDCFNVLPYYNQGVGDNVDLTEEVLKRGYIDTVIPEIKKVTSTEPFLKHFKTSNPTFHCYDPSDNEEKIGFSIVVEHILSDGASEEELQVLRTLLKEGYEQVETFYRIHNGIRMYCQSGNPAVELFSIDEWEEKTSDALSWFEGYDDDDLYDFQKYGVAIGEVTDSANYFVFYNGKVYYSEHDGGSDETGDLFFEFLERFRSDPVKTFQEMGGYVRFSDGKTNVQWIPKKYSDG